MGMPAHAKFTRKRLKSPVDTAQAALLLIAIME
jgi:hypothetical protein